MQKRLLIAGAISFLGCSEESVPPGDPNMMSGAGGTVAGGSGQSGSSGAGGTTAQAGSGGASNAGAGSGAGGASGGSPPSAGAGGAGAAGAGASGAAGAPAGAGGMAGSEGAGAPPVGGSAGASGGEAAGGTSAGGTAAGGSSGGSSCTRESLEAAVDVYLTALAAHDPSGASIASTAKYTENTETVMVGEGLWQTAGEAKLVRTLIDAEQCSSFSEVVLPEDGADSVMAVRLTHAAGSISEIEAIITRQGDWLFSAQGFLDSADQKWDILPEAERSTREELIEAPRSYYEYFEANEELPAFGPGCERLEGGQMVVGCPVGFPSGVSIGNRRYWADVEAGVSVAVALFGGDDSGLLDVHFFRMVESTIRNVHSLTVDSTFTTTGWPMGESADE